jgi:hypothetical protein
MGPRLRRDDRNMGYATFIKASRDAINVGFVLPKPELWVRFAKAQNVGFVCHYA